MADYRLIFRNAATGERTSGLSHLGFRVWIQYQLSADDFGVCPALAAKLQGDNTALLDESTRRIQAEIETLLRVDLCRVFTDGKRRYLYQPDWQDWQRIRYPVATSLPAIPSEYLRECSRNTQELFREHHGRASGKFSPHARACDAPATAGAAADVREGGAGEAAPVPPSRVGVVARAAALGIVPPGVWERQHGTHALRADLCDWVCLPASVHDEWLRRLVAAGATPEDATRDIRTWALDVRAQWSGRVPGDDIFAFWRHEWAKTHGSNRPSSAPKPGAGLDALITGGRHG
jgi:hypothetical protein